MNVDPSKEKDKEEEKKEAAAVKTQEDSKNGDASREKEKSSKKEEEKKEESKKVEDKKEEPNGNECPKDKKKRLHARYMRFYRSLSSLNPSHFVSATHIYPIAINCCRPGQKTPKEIRKLTDQCRSSTSASACCQEHFSTGPD